MTDSLHTLRSCIGFTHAVTLTPPQHQEVKRIRSREPYNVLPYFHTIPKRVINTNAKTLSNVSLLRPDHAMPTGSYFVYIYLLADGESYCIASQQMLLVRTCIRFNDELGIPEMPPR